MKFSIKKEILLENGFPISFSNEYMEELKKILVLMI